MRSAREVARSDAEGWLVVDDVVGSGTLAALREIIEKFICNRRMVCGEPAIQPCLIREEVDMGTREAGGRLPLRLLDMEY